MYCMGHRKVKCNLNVNIHVDSLDIPVSAADCTIYTVLYSLISCGENSAFAHFATAIAIHCNVSFPCSSRYPLLLGGNRQYEVRFA